MPISPHIERWLSGAGYEYHCFISWAHTNNRDMTDCAQRLKDGIEEYLSLSIPHPRVFLDMSEITGGAEWQRQLQKALCKSISMVSICAPIYYHPSHRWCGLEWAAMDELSNHRLPGATFKSIIPVLLKKDASVPHEVAQIQYLDFSGLILRGRHYYRTNDFRRKVAEIALRIEQVAQTIVENQSVTNCDQLIWPTRAAFEDYNPGLEPFPFRTAKVMGPV